MSTQDVVFWSVLALAGLVASALFSGLETGVYCVNRVRLHVQAQVPRSGAAVLHGLLLHPTRLLASLLVANNVANYLTTLFIGSLLDATGYTGWRQVAINAAILTPLLFIFGEVLPKDLFRSQSDLLTTRLARPLAWLGHLLAWTGILALLEGVGYVVRRMSGRRSKALHIMHPRRLVTQLMQEGVGHRLISPDQSDMMGRILEMDRLNVGDVMVVWSRATTLAAEQNPEEVCALAARIRHTRVPLLGTDGRPVGILELNQVLQHEPQACPPLASLAGPLVRLSPEDPLREALRTLQKSRAAMGVVFREEDAVGLVTTKNLVEPIVGALEAW